MPGKSKRFVTDPDFYPKMRAACKSLKEIGLIAILENTGMHRSCLCELGPESLIVEGDDIYLAWYAPKWRRKVRDLRAWIPPGDVETIRAWVNKYSKKNTDTYWRWIKEIGARAGFPNVSPMTFRAQRIVSLLKAGEDIRTVAMITGATPEVIYRHYAQAEEKEIKQEMLRVRVTSTRANNDNITQDARDKNIPPSLS